VARTDGADTTSNMTVIVEVGSREPSTFAVAPLLDGPDDPLGDGLGRASARHLSQLAPLLVPVDERCGLDLIDLEAPRNGFFGIVLTLDHFAAASQVQLMSGREVRE
jgi:hypothetical protein